MNYRYCFGYGSLVNRETHAFQELTPAELTGWKRTWSHRSQAKHHKASSLSISPSSGTTIKGLICRVDPTQIEQLDRREAGYDLHQIPSEALTPPSTVNIVHTYISANTPNEDTSHPILQSYLDTVLSGFLDEFGPSGVHHFLETTTGWETPILRDRTTPIYPRATALEDSRAEFFDKVLTDFGVNWSD